MSLSTSSQRGSALFIVLVAVALFAALSYALSQQREGVTALSNEKIRLLASDVIDMGNSMADAVSRLRLRQIPQASISFQNATVSGYTNPACTDDSCKIYTFDGGGKDWETPANEINSAQDWGFTGSLVIQNIGTTEPELVAILPNIKEQICVRINALLGIHDMAGTPSVIAAASASKFVGTFAAVPTTLADSQIEGQKSACVKVTTATGTAFTGAPLANTYVYYQVLDAR